MLTIARKIESSNHRDMYFTQNVNNSPGETSYGNPIAPKAITVLWEIHETVDGFQAKPLTYQRTQESAAGTHDAPTKKSVPDTHITELKGRLVFDLPINSSEEVTFFELDGGPIQKNKETVEQ